MKNYKFYLYQQFSKAMGYKYINETEDSYIKEFIEWLQNMRENTQTYVEFASQNGVELIGNNVIEIDKGAIDLISCKNKLVSVFGSTINEKDREFEVFEGKPIFISEGFKIEEGQANDTYSIHNPYSQKYCHNIDILMSGGYKACLGIFGETNDKDKCAKIKYLEDCYFKTNKEALYEYAEQNGSYYAMVYSIFEQRDYSPRRRIK